MSEISLKLLPQRRGMAAMVLPLHARKPMVSVEDIAISTNMGVFQDLDYTVEISGVQENQYVRFYVNEDSFGGHVGSDGLFYFDEKGTKVRLFFSCFGLCRIALEFTDESEEVALETDYIQVLVRKTIQYDSVRRMADYVYYHNPGLLYANSPSPDQNWDGNNQTETVESKLILLRRISAVYENNFRYFKANSRFVTAQEERVDDFQKLQYITDSTIRYISGHPEQLYQVQDQVGIRFGNKYYLPAKTLITSSTRSFDIYENRILLSFLDLLRMSLDQLLSQVHGMTAKIPDEPFEVDDYVSSSSIMYEGAMRRLRKLEGELKELKSKYYSLSAIYSSILKIKHVPVTGIPRLTPIFRAVPQYHQIYDCIVAWFDSSQLNLKDDQFMLTFINVSALYEIYVLSKMLNSFSKSGYQAKEVEKVFYSFSGETFYKNTSCNNKFVFQKGNQTVTVYYQPVLSTDDRRSLNGLGLYRNNTIPFSTRDRIRTIPGNYYDPDYVLKYEFEDSSEARYVVADAKYMRLDDVKTKEFSQLVYKYYFSLSPFNIHDSITELLIFNGVSDFKYDGVTNLINRSHSPRRGTPQAEIVTLTENSEDNTSLHAEILRGTIGRFIDSNRYSDAVLPVPGNDSADISFDNQPRDRSLNVSAKPAIPAINERAENESAAPDAGTAGEQKGDESNHLSEAAVDAPAEEKKKAKKQGKKTIDKGELLLESFNFRTSMLQALKAKGFEVVKDLVPDYTVQNLYDAGFRRSDRRVIEAVLKEKGVVLKRL